LHQEAVLCEELPKPPRVEALLELRLPLRPEKLLRVEAARWVWASRAASAVGREAVVEGLSG
jgi:hypothetical protein